MCKGTAQVGCQQQGGEGSLQKGTCSLHSRLESLVSIRRNRKLSDLSASREPASQLHFRKLVVEGLTGGPHSELQSSPSLNGVFQPPKQRRLFHEMQFCFSAQMKAWGTAATWTLADTSKSAALFTTNLKRNKRVSGSRQKPLFAMPLCLLRFWGLLTASSHSSFRRKKQKRLSFE